MKTEYLIFNLLVFFGPLLLSFIPFIFVKRLTIKETFYSISVPASIFLIWDFVVTGFFWNFNENYILGIKIGMVPIEEILFFITVPYSCLFLWKNWKLLFINDSKISLQIFILIFLGCIIFIFYNLPYTVTVSLVLTFIIVLDITMKTSLFNSKRFLYFLVITIFLTFITNGYLTARPIVTYNNSIKTNIQITTIPVEDFFYGIALISFVVILYEHNNKRSV